jgi:hypothetical protein
LTGGWPRILGGIQRHVAFTKCGGRYIPAGRQFPTRAANQRMTRQAPGAASGLAGEEFIVILMIVMACGLILPGVPHERHA